MGDIDAKILYNTIDINDIASIKLIVYGSLNSNIKKPNKSTVTIDYVLLR